VRRAQHRETGRDAIAPIGPEASGDPLDAREGGTQQQRVGQRGAVAVGAADRIWEPAQLAA
jgi:hypothetical protein